jgi:hypothetical protein
VYKWVDAAGVTHFSDQPAPNGSGEELPLRYRRTDQAAMQARLREKAELDSAAELRESQQGELDAAAEADRQKVLAERAANCKLARDRVAKYTDAFRLYKPGPNGERVYLSAEELDAERADANRSVEQWCGQD